jgi:DNA-binding NtrC family response regulator
MSRREIWQPPPNSPVLIVGSVPEDRAALVRILEFEDWRVQEAEGCAQALSLLEQTRFPVLICHQELVDGDWQDLLAACQSLPTPPQFIVFSRIADCLLWAEALNLGAWDVLGAPPVTEEVLRVVGLASQKWWRRKVDVQRAGAASAHEDFSPSLLEQELMHLAQCGLSDDEIAEALGIPSVRAARWLSALRRKGVASPHGPVSLSKRGAASHSVV